MWFRSAAAMSFTLDEVYKTHAYRPEEKDSPIIHSWQLSEIKHRKCIDIIHQIHPFESVTYESKQPKTMGLKTMQSIVSFCHGGSQGPGSDSGLVDSTIRHTWNEMSVKAWNDVALCGSLVGCRPAGRPRLAAQSQSPFHFRQHLPDICLS